MDEVHRGFIFSSILLLFNKYLSRTQAPSTCYVRIFCRQFITWFQQIMTLFQCNDSSYVMSYIIHELVSPSLQYILHPMKEVVVVKTFYWVIIPSKAGNGVHPSLRSANVTTFGYSHRHKYDICAS